MLRKFTSILVSTVLVSVCVNAQETVFGFKAGMNASVFSENLNIDPAARWGGSVGFFVKNGKGLLAELYFSPQGQKNEYVTGTGTKEGETVTRMNYVNLPILWEVGKKAFRFHVGPQFGLLFAANEKGTYLRQTVDEDLMDFSKDFDVGLAIGFAIQASEKISIGYRYNHGLSVIFETPDQVIPGVNWPEIRNRVSHFYVAVSF